MGIMTRFVRIFKADLHGVIDQLEDKGLLLKQYLRDMEAALEQKKARLQKVNVSRNQALRQRDRYQQEIDKLEQDLEVALRRNRDNIARLLIKKIKPLTRLRTDIEARMSTLDLEIAGFKECIDQQQIQYGQLKQQASEYFHQAEQKEWEKAISGFIPGNFTQELTEEEVELELIQRKETLRAQTGGHAQ